MEMLKVCQCLYLSGFLLIAGNRLFFPAVKPKVAGCWFWKKEKKEKKEGISGTTDCIVYYFHDQIS